MNLENKFFVLSMTKMATTHVQHVMHNLFPEKRIASFDKIYVPVSHNEWNGETGFEEKEHRKFCWGTRFLINDETVLDDADIFIDSGKREVQFGSHFLSKIPSGNAVCLNRNLRDWLLSEITYFHVGTDSEYVYQLFYQKQHFYKRLVNQGLPIINVTTHDVTEELLKFFQIKKPSLICQELIGARRHNLSPSYAEGAEETVNELFDALNITPEEENLPYIPRLT